MTVHWVDSHLRGVGREGRQFDWVGNAETFHTSFGLVYFNIALLKGNQVSVI